MKTMLVMAVFAACSFAADATGTWIGTVDIPAAGDREARSVPAHLVLKQEGTILTGSAGPNASQQFPIENGKIDNGTLRFQANAGDAVMKFALRQEGDVIKGDITREKEGDPPEKTTLSAKRAGPPLADEISSLDSKLFGAYNECNLEAFASLFSDDVEFYHDKGGRTDGIKALLDALQKNICGKVRRELVRESMKVYPIPGFGAVQEGQHRFSNSGSPFGKPAKFVHIWQNKGGQWKLTRVISYDH